MLTPKKVEIINKCFNILPQGFSCKECGRVFEVDEVEHIIDSTVLLYHKRLLCPGIACNVKERLRGQETDKPKAGTQTGTQAVT